MTEAIQQRRQQRVAAGEGFGAGNRASLITVFTAPLTHSDAIVDPEDELEDEVEDVVADVVDEEELATDPASGEPQPANARAARVSAAAYERRTSMASPARAREHGGPWATRIVAGAGPARPRRLASRADHAASAQPRGLTWCPCTFSDPTGWTRPGCSPTTIRSSC